MFQRRTLLALPCISEKTLFAAASAFTFYTGSESHCAKTGGSGRKGRGTYCYFQLLELPVDMVFNKDVDWGEKM